MSHEQDRNRFGGIKRLFRRGFGEPPAAEPVDPVPVVPESALPENSFTAFVNAHREPFGIFAQLTTDIDTHQKGFRSSPKFEALVSTPLTVLEAVRARGLNRTTSKRLQQRSTRETTKVMETKLFMERRGVVLENLGLPDVGWYRKTMNASEKVIIQNWERESGEFALGYRQTMADYERPLEITRQKLLSTLTEYLQKDYTHFLDFGAFLSGEEYGETREEGRVFFTSLADDLQKSGGRVFSQIHQEWVTRLSESPDDRTIHRFVSQIDFSSQDDTSREFYRLVQFGKATAMVVGHAKPDQRPVADTLHDVLVKLLPMAEWPSFMQEQYRQFVAKEFGNAFGEIVHGIEQFQTPPTELPASTAIERAFRTPAAQPQKRRKRR